MFLDGDSDGQFYKNKLKRCWKNYNDYKLILWMWMLNDVSVVWAVTELSHSGYYIHASLHFVAVIFVGIPVVYSEICLAQYTNCDVISMWDFFPLFRPIGYGTIYLVILKTIFMIVLTTWYMVYTVHSALDPPPWFSCDEFTELHITNCMVKRINVSVFQHCIETQNLYGDDCGFKTASNCFFEREIGNYTTVNWPQCIPKLKGMITTCSIGLILFILTLKHRFLAIGVKLVLLYLGIILFVLFCVALSTSGTWYASKNTISWRSYNLNNCFITLARGFLSLGTGTGMITYLSRSTAFRSPATMTSITTPLLSIFITLMFSLIAFSGIKTMSYYHGEEENVIELGDNYFFAPFASITEIISYFDALPIWGFAWFSAILACLFVQLWLLFGYLRELFFSSFQWTRQYEKCATIVIISCLISLACPFFCSDITPALIDAVDIIQIFSSLVFSLTLYWFYGYYNHNVDIIFMIGVKASYFWKITWLLNPVILVLLFITKFSFFAIDDYENSYVIVDLEYPVNYLLFLIIIGIYAFIIILGMIFQVIFFYIKRHLKELIKPTNDWGPNDNVLFKSRKMFVPEIMTREFLYRQVKIHGYCRNKKKTVVKEDFSANHESKENFHVKEWSALTSN
ncbi:sodium- and chloride-dependent GABA transporter 1-like [Choristoneura fumiferana]|uniref:sodium- and chloride-dependent GABA transporter 1-like n=1 Tax=Choristoneura fumiferana TaxID=7141 RepID=UPI003D154B25